MKKKIEQPALPFQPEKIQFLSFHLLRATLDGPFDFNLNGVRSYRVEWRHWTEINDDNPRMLKSNLSIQIATESESQNSSEAVGAFDFSFLFDVENLSSLLEKVPKGGVALSWPLANSIASISYSTVRGILLTRLQGTALRNFVLPVIDPNELLKPENSPTV